jgi:hypothetical protein
MCGIVKGLLGAVIPSPVKPKAPTAAALPDPAVERAKAETEAMQATNSKLAQKNRARAASALAVSSTSSDVAALGAAPGKTALGQ